ncbi:COG3650 family protein [Rhodalgimonas zhirmunskyi]|uniref:SH3 domain-containing protein n=1 Tax=Rhodalgimonas zhirmunskyi TaxID=2964767 RepID=A0AAJ1X5L1_9RHOB|nr:SH3 domain-containing protein [Rhodoalgimonas zhirmunskyi]MDQ2094264.1 SH3 domain-containing protein [Rhodoalgimonas zhirmunskyi]
MIRALALLLLLPVSALAQGVMGQTYPALHAVTGVASDDQLNVRSAPRAGSALVATLAPDARNIEVIYTDNGWGRINVGEGAGWASMRYLARQQEDDTPGLFPPRLACFGTEPFWSLDITPDAAKFATPEGESLLHIQDRMTSRNTLRDFAVMAGSTDLFLTATITPARCNDGMSDREFGLHSSAVIRFPDGYQLLSGCCTLPPSNR